MIHFITFGGPSVEYHHCVDRLCNEGLLFACFDRITGKTEKDLKEDKIFWNQHGKFIHENKKGYGYWIWKSYILMKYLQEEMNQDDILLYMDAGCTLNNNGKLRFLEYVDLLEKSSKEYGILSFQMNHLLEIHYTKKQVFTYFNTNKDDMLSGQCIATVIMMKKNNHSLFIMKEWYRISSIYELLNDHDNNTDTNHRHDQSIFSLLVKKYGSLKIPDETFFYPIWEKDGIKYPFWATRIRR